MHRMLVSGTGRTLIQYDAKQDVNSKYGVVSALDIQKAKDGDIVKSSSGESFIVYTPSFIDRYKRIRREAQIITFKDAGIIITTTGLGPESVVAEAGSGSGAMTVLLSRYCSKVYSYDISDNNISIAKENVERLGGKNVTFRLHDITKGPADGPLDCLILDVPEPWHTFGHLNNMKIGGYIVTYNPSAVQLQTTRIKAQEKGLMHVRSVEVTERHWMVRGDAVRPTSRNVAFTAFISFFRWMGYGYKSIMPPDKKKSKGPSLPSEELMRELF